MTQKAQSRKAWLTVAVLSLLYLFGTLDRQMMALLVGAIKRDLGFSDMEIGVLQGVAFSLFFVIASPPIGWLVDRVSRRAIIFWGTLVWASCAAVSGIASSFAQMFAARAGVGAGEATLQPSAFAIIADSFPAERLAFPMSVFVIGANVGAGLSFIFGGLIVQWAGSGNAEAIPLLGDMEAWRLAFLLTGIPGIALAFVAFLLPRSEPVVQAEEDQGDFARAWRHYRSHLGFYLLHNLAFACCIGMIVGLLAWNPAFLSRHYGWDAGSAGVWLGCTQIPTSLVALTVHGWAVDRLFRAGMKDAHMRWFAVMCPLAGCFAAAAYLVNDVWLMLALFNCALFCIVPYPGIAAAALQIATPPDLRGKLSSAYLIGLNLIGSLSGPMLVAAFTQYFFADEAKVGWSMSLTAALLMGLGTICCIAGLGPMRRAIHARETASA
jgi:MFS family permease